MKRYAASVAIGVVAFAIALVILSLIGEAFYASYRHFHAAGRSPDTRRLLAWVDLPVIVVPAVAALFTLSILAARRWRTNVLISVAVAGTLAGVIAHPLLFQISILNDCELNHAFPYYSITGCD